jgi:hypothetical protein
MYSPTNPFFTPRRASRSLHNFLISAAERVVFFSIAVLITLAGATVFLNDSRWRAEILDTTVAVLYAPSVPTAAQRVPNQVATVQDAYEARPQ